MRFWISWYQPTVDYRPITDPPHAGVIGWWCSGYTENAATLVALVETESQEAAEKIVQVSWPEAEEWRFCEPREDTFLPGDRFPMSEWMMKRHLREDNNMNNQKNAKHEITATDVINLLNDLIKLDPKAITALMENRVKVTSQELIDHPTVTVSMDDELGVLGILNGLFTHDIIIAEFNDDETLIKKFETRTEPKFFSDIKNIN